MNSPLDSLTVWPAGSAPLIARLCDAINLAGVIDRMVRWDPKQCRTSLGTLIRGLTINVLSGRKALYKVQEYFAEQDLRVLFCQDIEEDTFNDDALGRSLDKLAAAGPKKMYSSVAFSAITKEKVIFNSVHADTTSKNVYGNYEGSEQNEETLNITYGYSKDYRPNLNRLCSYLYGCKYRFIAIQSTRLDARKEKTIAKQIENERQNLGKACHNLNKRVFYCLADAEKEW